MSMEGDDILEQLGQVDRLRAERAGDPPLAERIACLKAYQSERFSRSYADLLQEPRYRGAARFFLDELYGPQEFGARDAQFARVVPALVRMFPHDVVATVGTLARLHALSESLDSDMARQLTSATVERAGYIAAWQATGRPDGRRQQIDLTLQIGVALDRFTRKPGLRTMLRMMRRPAQTAGLGELQRFLEAGFETFGAMRGAADFLGVIDKRESALVAALFGADAITCATALSSGASASTCSLLGQLP